MVYSSKTSIGLILGLSVCASAGAQTYPSDCTPLPTPVGCIPPPEWTPRLAFFVPTMPQEGGSVPKPWIIAQPSAGEIYAYVPLTWDVYQSKAAADYNFPYTLIKSQMNIGDSFVAHLKNGLYFVAMRHQFPPPNRDTLYSLGSIGYTSAGGGASSNNGMLPAFATPLDPGIPGAPGDVTIEIF